MKYIRAIIISVMLAAVLPSGFVGCSTAPTERVAQVRTLQAIGETAATSMQVAAKLRTKGLITAEQWNKVAAFHDSKFLPAYKLAIAAVSADLSTPASADLVGIVTQLAALVAELEKH